MAEIVHRTDTALLSNFVILSLPRKFGEGSCLILENSGNGLDGVTTLELLGEWVFRQCYASLFFVILQDNLEKVSKARRW